MSPTHVVLTLGLILHVLSVSEAELFNLTLVRKGILDYLDIPDQQQIQNHQQKAQAAPEFMKQLYRMKIKNQGNYLKQTRDDIVRFFYPKAQRIRKTNTLNYEFNFNLSALQTKEKVSKAVLRLYRRRTKLKSGSTLCSLALFLQEPRARQKRNKRRSTAVFVSIKIVSLSGKRRWVQFNVSKVLEDQLKKHPNKIVQFKVFVVAYAAKLPPKSWIGHRGKHRPNLIVYSRPRPGARRKAPRLDLTALTNLINVPIKSRAKRGNNDQYCKRRHLYVKFNFLKINWIVAPLGFSAYTCQGTCPEVLTSNFNPNNHAILQNLLHYRYSKDVPQVSCVPTSLQSLTLLYNEEGTDTFKLKEFPDMVASSCGCR